MKKRGPAFYYISDNDGIMSQFNTSFGKKFGLSKDEKSLYENYHQQMIIFYLFTRVLVKRREAGI